MAYMSEYAYVNLITMKISVFFSNLILEKCEWISFETLLVTQYTWLSSQYVFHLFSFSTDSDKGKQISRFYPQGLYSIIGNVKHQHV